jgi:hypothetical protein
MMEATVGNIGARGCQRRRTGGYVWAAVTLIALAAMVGTHVSRTLLLLLALPIAFAAFGFLQAREQTCVVHALLGTRENDDGVVKLDPNDQPEVRRRAWRVTIQSIIAAVVLTAVIYLVAGLR